MTPKRTGPPRWLYFILGVGALMASGVFLGIARADGFTTGRIIRIILFGLLGILWVFWYGDRSRRHIPDGPPNRATPANSMRVDES
jgi:hypothetical protein